MSHSRVLPGIAIVTTLSLIAAWTGFAPATPEISPPLRVGVYESRAIAIAFARSNHMEKQLAELKEQLEKAKAAGDETAIKSAEVMGPKLQDSLHQQGFGSAPVTELLEVIREALPAICKEAGVALIVAGIDCKNDVVEVVDVTALLVQKLDPSPETLKAIESIKKQKTLPWYRFPLRD